MILDGRIRIPALRRGLGGWESSHVCELLDSVYRGFPIGSVLLREAPAEAAEVRVGPVPVMATERRDALWVVDGQRRLTSLAAALGRPTPLPAAPVDPFVVYFDAATRTFQPAPGTGRIEPTWVPLPRLLDSSRLTEWVSSWDHQGDAALRAAILEAGRRLREYRVPLCVIRTDDEELLRTAFARLQRGGEPLPWSEVRDGLFEHGGEAPSSLPELADALSTLGMGRPTADELASWLAAYQGQGASVRGEERLRHDPAILAGAAAAALPTLRRALGFLRSECKIPHLRLLPYPALLAVLTRFFREHPEPNDRTRTLLTRWIWRTLLAPAHDADAVRRAGVTAITSDEEASVQELLRLAPIAKTELALPADLDARSPAGRLALLGLASLNPLDLDAGRPTEPSELLRERDVDALRLLFPPTAAAADSAAARILLPGDGAAAEAVRALVEQRGLEDPVLRSHAIDATVAAAILDGDEPRALARRAELIASSVKSLGNRLAAWGRSDSPSLEYLMRKASA